MKSESKNKNTSPEVKAMIWGIVAGIAVTIVRNPPVWGAFLRFFTNLPF